MSKLRWLFAVGLMLALTGLTLPTASEVAAATLTVSTCDKASLHQAIDDATAGDTITFACSGTISLAGPSVQEFQITKDLTIDGSGQNVIIDGAANNSAFYVYSNVNFTLKNLTFTNGYGASYSSCQGCETDDYGGVITSTGNLTISNSIFDNNHAAGKVGGGAINSFTGTVIIDQSTFSNNTSYKSGGALVNLTGTLNVSNSTFDSNATDTEGGAIVNGATAHISNSTFRNNLATGVNGDGSGGGVANTSDMTITNSTFSGNNAQAGGAIANGADLSIIHSTLVGNHADWWANGILTGVRAGINLSGTGTTTLTNTILANGPPRDGGDGLPFGGNCVTAGTLVNSGGNFVDDDTCGATQVSTADLHLGTLVNNGGPTQTIALASGSAAINMAPCLPEVRTDQRGYTRPSSGFSCDSGAYEFGAMSPVQTTALIFVTGSGTYGATATLLATLSANGSGVAGKTITFSLNGTPVGSATTGSSGVATLSDVSLSGINAGSYPNAISASFAGDAGSTSASGSGPLTVNKASQSISFDLSALPTKSLGDPPFDVSSYASASSGLPVSFSSVTPTICTVSGGTVSLVALGTCTLDADQAGNGNYTAATQVQQSFAVTDTTPPVTTASAVTADSAPYAFGSWTHQAVTVTLAASDSGGGVASTSYSLDGGSVQPYTAPITISTDGAHTLTFWSVDAASNEETPHQSVAVKIDTQGPTISGAPTSSPNTQGWYNGAVTIHWTCSDTLSGIASCPSDQVISTEGASQTLSGTATDQAGNSVTVSSSPAVNIDLTAPTSVVASPDRPADSNGWYNHGVSVTFSGEDATSGIASCSSTSYSGPDSATASVVGSCIDQAGNTAAGAMTLAYDATTPTVTYSGNAETYHIGDTVTITCVAGDNLSGIATTDCADISAPAYTFAVGENTISSSATDAAGNTGTGSVTFTVIATADDLSTLTQQFVSNRTIARQLAAPLAGVQFAEQIHSPRLKAAFVNSYILLVNTQRGRTLTSEEADILISLAKTL